MDIDSTADPCEWIRSAPPRALRGGVLALVPWEIALALKSAPDDVRALVLAVMMPDDRIAVQALIVNLGRVRVSDVEEMQARLVSAIARAM